MCPNRIGPRPAGADGARTRAAAQGGAPRCDHGPSPRSRHIRCRATRSAQGGGSIAEGSGDVGHRTRPVGLDSERIVAVSIADGLVQGALTKRRIAGDNRTLERQSPGHRRRRPPRCFRRHPHPPNPGPRTTGKGRHKMNPFAPVATRRSAAPQALAVQRNMPRRVGTASPRPRHTLRRFHIERLEK